MSKINMTKRVIYVSNYAAFYSGNFISSLMALEEKLNQCNIAVSYVFPERAPFFNWGGRSLKTMMCIPLISTLGLWLRL